MRLYLNERPRTFVIVDSLYALIIRHPDPRYKGTEPSHRHVPHIHHERGKHREGTRKTFSSNKVLVEFLQADALDLSSFTDITPRKTNKSKQLHAFLGLLNVKGYIHLGFVTRYIKVASPRIDESIHMVKDVEFYCLNSDEYDSWIHSNDEDLQPIHGDESEGSLNGYPAASVKRFLSSGHFYYSRGFDITCSLQERGNVNPHTSVKVFGDPYSKRFAWNKYMMADLMEMREALNSFEKSKIDSTGFLTVLIRGYCKSVNVTLHDDEDALMTLISRQSCKKTGVLFGESGCDDDGEVPNYLESEVILYSQNFSFSYVVIRGNVPSFWEVENHFTKNNFLSKNYKKLKLTRSFEVSNHAFTKHFNTLNKHFGDVYIVNCLSSDKKTYKGELNENFVKHYEEYTTIKRRANSEAEDPSDSNTIAINSCKVTFTSVPVTSAIIRKYGYSPSVPSELIKPLTKYMVDIGATFYDSKKGFYVGEQLGVFRVNSFDCLSKANFVSKIISQEVMELAFRDMSIPISLETLSHHARLWSENGEVIKVLTSAYMTSKSKVQPSSTKEAIRQSLTKKYLNIMRDPKASETAMLKLLGRLPNQDGVVLFNPVHQYLNSKLKERAAEFSSRQDIKIFSTTFNVNGTVYQEENLKELFFPKRHPVDQNYDLVFIGFQEIVELTPGKMISAKSDNFVIWDKTIKRVLNKCGPSKEQYVSLWGWQLGGIAMLLYIKESQMGYISNIEGSVKKTGLGGMSANKGGIGVSFEYSNTSFCFVTSHLAAGHGNVDERHHNYKTLAKGIMFLKHKKVRDHDAVIWLGDFNFRIELPNDEVRSLIESKDYQKLVEFDQLNTQMANGESFPYYNEMEICFPPTYKFDNDTKTYDTSEKQRTPAWTDRILSLSKNNILKQEVYDCEENIVFSDHRPVYSIFTASVEVINEKTKKEVSHEIFESYTKVMGDINWLLTANDVSKFVANANDDVIPPPSSDTAKWWLDSGLAAKVHIEELEQYAKNGDIIVNPFAPINPFVKTEEPAFIRKDSLLQTLQQT